MHSRSFLENSATRFLFGERESYDLRSCGLWAILAHENWTLPLLSLTSLLEIWNYQTTPQTIQHCQKRARRRLKRLLGGLVSRANLSLRLFSLKRAGLRLNDWYWSSCRKCFWPAHSTKKTINWNQFFYQQCVKRALTKIFLAKLKSHILSDNQL